MDTPSMLSAVDSIHVATVLEDCVDQLYTLGCIMPASYLLRPDAPEVVQGEITELIDRQLELEQKYHSVLSKKVALIGTTKNPDKLLAIEKEIFNIGGDLKNSAYIFGRSLRQNPLTADNLIKVQKDRAFVERVLSESMTDLVESCNFQTLTEAVRAENEHKASLLTAVRREQDSRRRIKELQRELQDVRKEEEMEIQQRKEMISHLKDQLQEMKAKTIMEGKYIKKCADVSVAQTQKHCLLTEKQRREDIETLHRKIDEENRAHQEIVSYLNSYKAKAKQITLVDSLSVLQEWELDKKLEFWSEKYETDKENKQKELDTLKQTKAKDLEKLQELTKLYKEYEMIVVEDRIEKEKARRKADQEAIEMRAIIRLQAWWRAVMVRKGLGPFSKKKKKKGRGKKGKGKKGKGSGKKGKGGKGKGKKKK